MATLAVAVVVDDAGYAGGVGGGGGAAAAESDGAYFGEDVLGASKTWSRALMIDWLGKTHSRSGIDDLTS